MKKLILFLCAVICISMAGCGSSRDENDILQNKKNIYGYSLAPAWKDISNEEKKDLLKEIKESGEPKSGLSFYAFSAIWKDDGTLEIKGFIRNNTGGKVTDISGEFTVSDKQGDIAQNKFTLNKSEFGELSYGDNRPWTLLFPSDSIIRPGVELKTQEYLVKFDAEYKIVK